ncbi:Spx/MgsR family RNA polymerase-binding regulatory protein [Aliikangiella maris]|uniref:Spx/MgsR family RNA polymerase-binding regulatory protein n=2 Tax=Aliikangiella maris TaxID=3162458 RepID=A0ABV2BTA4_9GAMM
MSQVEVYGIKNCDTVKKALTWLTANQIEFEFHDFKKEIPNAELIQLWLELIGQETLINRRGTTWRNLNDSQKSLTDTDSLIDLIMQNTSLIKRPVLKYHGNWTVGFKAETWQTYFGKKQN